MQDTGDAVNMLSLGKRFNFHEARASKRQNAGKLPRPSLVDPFLDSPFIFTGDLFFEFRFSTFCKHVEFGVADADNFLSALPAGVCRLRISCQQR